jgi:hypothetical protein
MSRPTKQGSGASMTDNSGGPAGTPDFSEYAESELGDARGHCYRPIKYAEVIDAGLAWRIDKGRRD